MFEIKGKVNTAICYASVVEDMAIEQIRRMCDYEITRDSKIRIMPDVHAGKGCTIGTTMTITDKAVPNIVGVDIGCGMYTVNLGKGDIDFEKLDKAVHYIPSGKNVWKGRRERFDLQELRCYRELKHTKRLERSVGTLGGGNHFIEADKGEDGSIYLVIHSGSRHLGLEVAKYYQLEAYRRLNSCSNEEANALIAKLKSEGKEKQIQKELKKLDKTKHTNIPKALAYTEGDLFEQYIHAGEKLLIPINMRDGSLICSGKGNPDWNCSAPHGAGRLMSRGEAKETLTLSEFKKQMEGIYSTSVSRSTIDESPMAYKSIDDIVSNISDTADITEIIKPIYNFKAGD